jgi:hypothetical protein
MFVHISVDEPGRGITLETWRYSRTEPCVPGEAAWSWVHDDVCVLNIPPSE